MTDADATSTVRRTTEAEPAPGPDTDHLVTAHSSAPGRTVLTERGNTDAWIASDLTLSQFP